MRHPIDLTTNAAPLSHGARLVADIGGSNARFGWLAPGSALIEQVQTLPVAQHACLADAAATYLDSLRQTLAGRFSRPAGAALAVATAVTGDTVELTNSSWSFSQADLRAALRLDSLRVLNDFEALALALPRLDRNQLRPHGQWPPPPGTKAVIGPGTGLGVACATPTRQGWLALPGEGGHMSIAPGDDFESALLAVVRGRYEHVSAERLLSGIGLPVLHAAVCQVLGVAEVAALEAPLIVDQGLAGEASCLRTLETFCALLGSFAGNVALTAGARGGVYIGGGIVPRLGEMFFLSRFRERFEAKGRLRPYLEAIPTALITDTLVALTGAAAALEPTVSAMTCSQTTNS